MPTDARQQVMTRIHCVVEHVQLVAQPRWATTTNKGEQVPIVIKVRVKLHTGGIAYLQTRVGKRINPPDGPSYFETSRLNEAIPWTTSTGEATIRPRDILQVSGVVGNRMSQNGNPYTVITNAIIVHHVRPG